MGTERRRPRWLELLVSPGREAEDYVRSHARKVSDVMTGEVVTATPQTPLEDVVQLMERHHVKRVPVVERGKLVGIVSRANLLSALAKLFGAEPARPLTDAEITKRILEEIKKQPWAPRSSVEIAVENGVVELSGAVVDEREREALRVCAEIVPGVKEVRDRLAWIEPVSGMVIDAPPEPTQKGGAKR
jgi:CBS-domain-containing membrane protein